MIKILILLGFKELRQKGSHKFFINDKGLTTVIPIHNEDLTRGLIRKILKDINIAIDEYEKLKKSNLIIEINLQAPLLNFLKA